MKQKSKRTAAVWLLFWVSLCIINFNGYAQSGTWKEKKSLGITAPPPQVRVSFAINNKGYVSTTGYADTSHQMWEYDPLTNTWTQKASFAGYILSAVGFACNGKGYMGTGNNKQFFEFDPLANKWTRKADVPGNERFQAVGFAIGTKGYIGTGNDSPDFWEYNPSTNAWTRKADFAGGARSRAVAFSMNNKGYISTGVGYNENMYDARSDLWEYDPATNRWTEKAPFAGGKRQVASAFSIGTKGYIGLGMDSLLGQSNDFWEYNPATNAWTRKADFKGEARFLAMGFSIAGKGYFGAGSAWTDHIRKDLWEYNPLADAWTEKAGFNNMSREGAIAFSIGNKGYVGGGGDGEEYKKDFWEYDAANNVWTQKANIGGGERYGAVAFSIGGKGYIGTGTGDGWKGTKDFWEYDPALNLWTRKADFPGTGRYLALGFSVGNKGYIGTGSELLYSEAINDFYEYNPLLNQWTRKADFAGPPTKHGVGFSIENKGYAGLGASKTFWQYDPLANAWIQKASYPDIDTIEAVAWSIGSKGYVGLGGFFFDHKRHVYEYNPAMDKWTRKTDFPGGNRSQAVAFTIGSRGYVATGNQGSSHSSTSDLWEFDPTNSPPLANGWLMKYYSPTSVLLNGWGSYDPEGGTIKFWWEKLAGPEPFSMLYQDASTPVISNLVTGTYTFRLTVTDNQGATGVSDVTFSIKYNQPPIANGWLMKYFAADSILLNAWGSYDPEGGPVKFWWDKIAGPSQYTMWYQNASTPVIFNLVNGTYKFQLTVTDQEGAAGRDTVDIIISGANAIAGNRRAGNAMENAQPNSPAKLHVFPNPVHDVLNIGWSGIYQGNAVLTVMDMSGRQVKTTRLTKQVSLLNTSINVDELKTGNYQVSIRMENGTVLSTHIMKQ